MNKFLHFLKCFILGSAFFSMPVIASSTTEALNSCVADNTSGRDRKDLAQWIFVAMTAHPDIKPLSSVTEANRDDIDKKLAALATRLMTDSCKVETKAAMRADGGAAIEAAFGALGELAMKELMTNSAVNASVSRYGKYLDKSKFESAFK